MEEMNKFILQVKKVLASNAFVSFIMASLTYYIICNMELIKVYDILSWLIYFSLIILYYKTDKFNKTMKKEVILLSLLFSFLTIFGKVVYNLQYNNELSVFRELLKIKNLFNFLGVFNILFIILVNILPKLYNFSLKSEKTFIKNSKVVYIISFLVILLAWLPYFLSYYPGTLTPDSFQELGIIANNFSSISDHHPIIHVLFIYLPYTVGFKFFHSMTIGIVFATIFQMIILSSIFASFIVFLYNRKVNDYILLITVLFYSILPMHGYMSIVMWKDVIFSGLLLLLTMQLFNILEKVEHSKLCLRNLFGFIIISILCVFFRNNAIYMYVILAVVTLINFRKKFKIFAIIFCIVFGIYFFVKGPIFNYLNISKSASAEYIGMPLQQIGRMAFKNVQFTSYEKKIINKVIPIETMASSYNPKVSDGIKFNSEYNGSEFDSNKFEYLNLYLNLVKKHFSIALESYAISTLGYWYPGVEYWSVSKEIWENSYNIKIQSKTPNNIKKIFEKAESRYTPILNIEWSIGLCFWVILIFSVITFKKRGIKYLYPFIPVFGVWLTMMIASPVFGEFRYVYGAYVCLPLFMLLPYINFKKN